MPTYSVTTTIDVPLTIETGLQLSALGKALGEAGWVQCDKIEHHHPVGERRKSKIVLLGANVVWVELQQSLDEADAIVQGG